jgi:hypothetical protein
MPRRRSRNAGHRKTYLYFLAAWGAGGGGGGGPASDRGPGPPRGATPRPPPPPPPPPPTPLKNSLYSDSTASVAVVTRVHRRSLK